MGDAPKTEDRSRGRDQRPAFDFVEDVFQHGNRRNPGLLKHKWERMSENRFHFFRGSGPSFYRLWEAARPMAHAPAIWACGDAHWENVGSYRGKNKIAYFDLTDFDQACLAPLDAELGRALTAYSVVHASHLAPHFLSAYRETLAGGKPQHIEAEVAKGVVADLLAEVSCRKRKSFIADWTESDRIRIRKDETYALSRTERSEAVRIFRAWAAQRQQASFFQLLDLCGSLAGIGTMGLRRYLVLVKGGHRPHLIDMKEAGVSAPAAFRPELQPEWSCEAERIATVQKFTQYVPIAHLGWTHYRGLSFVLSDFQPSEDRVDTLSLPENEHESFAAKWGRLLAWSHLRTASWKRASSIDELMAFGKETLDARMQKGLLRCANKIGRTYEKSYREFVRLVKPKSVE
jgi:hypothetical protein